MHRNLTSIDLTTDAGVNPVYYRPFEHSLEWQLLSGHFTHTPTSARSILNAQRNTMGSYAEDNYSPRQVLEKFYDAEKIFTSAPAGSRKFEHIAETLADDFYMQQSSALPWAGEYRGPQQLKEWLERVSEWVVIDVRDPEIFENSDSDRIVVLSTVYYTCHKTGEKLDFPLSQTFVIDRERGQIKEIRSYYWDIQRLNKAMGYTS